MKRAEVQLVLGAPEAEAESGYPRACLKQDRETRQGNPQNQTLATRVFQQSPFYLVSCKKFSLLIRSPGIFSVSFNGHQHLALEFVQPFPVLIRSYRERHHYQRPRQVATVFLSWLDKLLNSCPEQEKRQFLRKN